MTARFQENLPSITDAYTVVIQRNDYKWRTRVTTNKYSGCFYIPVAHFDATEIYKERECSPLQKGGVAKEKRLCRKFKIIVTLLNIVKTKNTNCMLK